MKVRRMNHRMVTLGKKVFALGGQRHLYDDTTLDYVEVFNDKSKSWSQHLPRLLSKTTNGLAVTELPLTAVSCNKGCKCGYKSGARIVGGREAEVYVVNKDFFQILFQVGSHPWLGLLLTEGRKDILYSQCAATLVGSS